MKLASFLEGADTVYGVVVDHGDDAGIIAVDAEFRARFRTIRSLLERAGLGELREQIAGRTPDRALDDIAYRPPLHDAEKVICIGVNYAKRHPVHGVIPPPENITLFGKFEVLPVERGPCLSEKKREFRLLVRGIRPLLDGWLD